MQLFLSTDSTEHQIAEYLLKPLTFLAEPSEEESLVTFLEAVDKYKEQGHLNDAKELLEAKLLSATWILLKKA